MVARGELPEPTSAAHLAKLEPLKRIGGKMSKEACQDPEKAKYIGECCSGTRMWGDLGADIYVDDKGKQWAVFCCGACKAPLPWLPLPPLAAPSPPVTLTLAQKEMIEEKRQVALARKRAREERVMSSSPPCGPGRPTAHVPRPCAAPMSDWLLPVCNVADASEHHRLGRKRLACAAGLRKARALGESDGLSAGRVLRERAWIAREQHESGVRDASEHGLCGCTA